MILALSVNRPSAARKRRERCCRAVSNSVSTQQHLIIESNGLFGSPKNWEVMNKTLARKLDPQHYLIHPAQVNQLSKTFEGIDICGERLATEIKGVVRANPNLKYISMLGHSMGGLLLRYAAGQLYDPKTGLIGQLEPAHFITLATPHMGCDVQGDSQVPMLGLLTPVISEGIADSLFPAFAKVLLDRTGQQLFMEDRTISTLRQAPAARAVLAGASTGSNTNASAGNVPDVSSESLAHQISVSGVRQVEDARAAVTAAGGEQPSTRMQNGGEGAYDQQGAGVKVAASDDRGSELTKNQSGGAALRSSMGGTGVGGSVQAGGLPDAFTNVNLELPLLARMALDVPGSASFYSALQAFCSRTCYGSVCSDHLVGWSNSTLRSSSELPQLNVHSRVDTPEAKGVIREDPIDCAWRLQQAHSMSSDDHSVDASDSVAAGRVATGVAPNVQCDAQRETVATEGAEQRSLDELQQMACMPRVSLAAAVLRRMCSLSWARVDCAWRDAQVSLFAHNHIQVTRGWLNSDGQSVCEHVGDRFTAMERKLALSRPDYFAPGSTATRNR